jgi:hypothetical protein
VPSTASDVQHVLLEAHTHSSSSSTPCHEGDAQPGCPPAGVPLPTSRHAARAGRFLKMMFSALCYGNATALINDPAQEDVLDPVKVRGRCSSACGLHVLHVLHVLPPAPGLLAQRAC